MSTLDVLIDSLMNRLNISNDLREEILRTYSDLSKIIPRGSTELKLGAAIFIVFSRKSTPISINVIAKAFGYKSKNKLKYLRKGIWTFVSKYMKNMNLVSLTDGVNIESTKQFILEQINDTSAIEIFTKIYSLAKEKFQLKSPRPSVFLAACTLVTFDLLKIDDGVSRVIRRFKVTRPSLIKWYRLIKQSVLASIETQIKLIDQHENS